MKRNLLAVLLVAGLSAIATAQEQQMPVGAPEPLAAEASEMVAPAVVQCDPCCTPLKKVCCPQPHKKTTTHVEYGHKCEDFCLPRSSCLAKLFGRKNDCNCCDTGCCDDTACGKVRERKKLVKKVRKEEKDEMKCEPVHVPDVQPCQPARKCKTDPCVAVPCPPR